ncbi:putative glycosyl kinase/dehydrogenase [Candidatus Hepatincolaceae symbiont of Richtersius coronifer]
MRINYKASLIRSKAPLRLGLAGGGTDLPSFFENYNGGCVLNIALSLCAYCTLRPTNDNKIRFIAQDINVIFESDIVDFIEPIGDLRLHKAAYNRIVKYYNKGLPIGSFELSTYSEVPSGSGLGSSSTIMVAIINAYKELLGLPFGEYDLAELSYNIERKDLLLQGGKQDQYCAAFGGANFIEFMPDNKVIVNSLNIRRWILTELEQSILLYFTGKSRDSGNIIEQQSANLTDNNAITIKAMQIIKEEAFVMKEGLLKWDIELIKRSMVNSWEAKKMSGSKISNPDINRIYDKVINMGAYCGKISGAGGGGFMMFLVDPLKKMAIIKELNKEAGYILPCHFSPEGAYTWTV